MKTGDEYNVYFADGSWENVAKLVRCIEGDMWWVRFGDYWCIRNINPNDKVTPGERYRVYNFTLSGQRVLEGIATLVKRSNDRGMVQDDRWMVHFDGDEPGQVYPRFIDPEDKVN